MLLLNVGGGAGRNLPDHFKGWDQELLDIDPAVKPDIQMDARLLDTLPGNKYDAILCSHVLEHFYKHDVPKVLNGFLHVLKDEGFAEIIVPDIKSVFLGMQENSLDLSDVWYRTQEGTPITFHDVLYGWNHAMERGNLFYSHKCGFTIHSLGKEVLKAGFKGAQVWEFNKAVYARAFKNKCQSP